MGLFNRSNKPDAGDSVDEIRTSATSQLIPDRQDGQSSTKVTATLYSGNETLEVVGESYHQSELRQITGEPRAGARVPKLAVLVPEPDNPYDPNAIRVQIDGLVVGHLSREDAALYLPGLRRLMDSGNHVALEAMVVCGGPSGQFGVFLDHDPADFGLCRAAVPPGQHPQPANMRTGFTEAWRTDVGDDAYDLSWFDSLPPGDRDAVVALTSLLAEDPDPIDRHFQFSELESRLYRLRDIEPGALSEFDEVCGRHDAEMDEICAAFRTKWGKIPLLETYKQMAIRQAKAKDWHACVKWIDRGLALYGDDAARGDSVEDLERRRVRAAAKLERPAKNRVPAPAAFAAPLGLVAAPLPPPGEIEIETLTCVNCLGAFDRRKVRGRKPTLCPACRTTGG